jgi:hypothetical protein
LLGERELERYQSNLSTPSGDGNSQQSGGYQRTKEHVLLPASFGTELYVDERKNGGPTALIVTSKVAAVIKWPFPALRAQRPAHLEATWIIPGFVRPVWGKTPPMVAIPAQIPASDSAAQGKPDEQKAAPLQATVQPHIPENPDVAAPAGDGAGTMIADQVIDSMLDAVIPGAGMLHSMMTMFSGSGGGDASAPAMLRKPVQLVSEGDCDTHESDGAGEDEEEAEQ